MCLGWFCCLGCFYVWGLSCPTPSTGPMVGTPEARGIRQRSGSVFVCASVHSFLTERFQLVMNLPFYSLSLSVSQISEEIKLCEAGECSYFRPQRRNILRNLLVSELTVPYPVLHGCSLPHNVPHIWTLHITTKHCTIAVH